MRILERTRACGPAPKPTPDFDHAAIALSCFRLPPLPHTFARAHPGSPLPVDDKDCGHLTRLMAVGDIVTVCLKVFFLVVFYSYNDVSVTRVRFAINGSSFVVLLLPGLTMALYSGPCCLRSPAREKEGRDGGASGCVARWVARQRG